MSKPVWTFEKDELLIELVESKPGLYDLQSPHYSDNNYKKKMWNEIEQIVEATEAKTRWESLRAQYRKYLAKLKTKSGQAAKKITKWRYCDQMQFLNDHLTADRPRISSIADEETDHESNDSINNERVVVQATSLRESDDNEEMISANDCNHSVHQSTSASTNNLPTTQTKKMKRTNVNPESASSTLMKYILENKKSERPVDSIDQFFSLMATTVEKFSTLDQHVAKTQVFSLINKIEEKYLVPAPIILPPASTHHSQISPGTSSDSSSTFNYLDISQSSAHDSSRDCPTPSSQYTYIQQQPVNVQSYNFSHRNVIPPIPPATYYDSSSGLQRSTASNVPVSTVLTDNNLQVQYSSTMGQHQERKEPY